MERRKEKGLARLINQMGHVLLNINKHFIRTPKYVHYLTLEIDHEDNLVIFLEEITKEKHNI